MASGTLEGIPFNEFKGSGNIELTDSGMQGTRIYDVAWSQLMAFGRALIRTEWISVGGFHFQQEIVNPWIVDPETTLVCRNFRSVGIGPAGIDEAGVISYTIARITANYAPISDGNFSPTGDPEDIGDVNITFGGEFLSIPKGTWKFDGTDHIIEEPLGIMIPYSEVMIEVLGIPTLPRLGIRKCMGKLNSKVWKGANRGHVLFLGGSSRQKRTIDGDAPYDLSLQFKEKTRDWNYALGKDGTWRKVVDKATGEKTPYEYEDFDFLLQVLES